MSSISPRSQYLADGKTAWSLAPMAVVVSLAAAAAVGWVFQFVFFQGFYWFILVPVVGGFALAGVLRAMVRWTRCRNQLLAGALGLIVGLTTYAAYYEFCMIHVIRHNVGWHFDWLPRYIWHRLNTDVIRSSHEIGNPQNQRGTPNLPLNCVLFGIDFSILVGITTHGPWKRAGYAYCPELGQWMRRESATWPAFLGQRFIAALQEDSLMEFVARTPAGGNPRVCCRLTVEYAAPPSGSTFTYPIYATLADAAERPTWHRPKTLPVTLLRQIVLAPAETLALRPLFPELAKLLSAQHPELAALPADVIPAAAAIPAGAVAQITGVSTPSGRRIRTPGANVWVTSLRVAPLLCGLGGALTFGGGFLLFVKTLLLPIILVAAPIAVGLMGFGLYAAICYGVLEGRSTVRRLRQEIALRPDALVDPADADAACMSLIPRASFNSLWTPPAADVMLVKIDAPQRRLLMEGDENRYEIPAAAISECGTQCFFHRSDNKNSSQIWMLRLVVQLQQGSRELLLCVNPVRWVPASNKRRRRAAEEMLRQIAAIRSGGEAGLV